MNWQQTNREHRYKYTGDNGSDRQHLEGVETSTKTGETDQGLTREGTKVQRGERTFSFIINVANKNKKQQKKKNVMLTRAIQATKQRQLPTTKVEQQAA